MMIPSILHYVPLSVEFLGPTTPPDFRQGPMTPPVIESGPTMPSVFCPGRDLNPSMLTTTYPIN